MGLTREQIEWMIRKNELLSLARRIERLRAMRIPAKNPPKVQGNVPA